MSLKKCVLALILANVAYFGYGVGWFSFLTGSEASQREPERLKKQINTEALRIEAIQPEDAIPTAVASTEMARLAPECAKNASRSETWLVYMGPYASKDLLAKKKLELQKLKIDAREVAKTSLPLGLALGNYPSEELARQGLKAMNQNGVRTATVILWSTESNSAAAACPS